MVRTMAGGRLTGVVTALEPTPWANARLSERRAVLVTVGKVVGVALTVTWKESGGVMRTLFDVAAGQIVDGDTPVAATENVIVPKVVFV